MRVTSCLFLLQLFCIQICCKPSQRVDGLLIRSDSWVVSHISFVAFIRNTTFHNFYKLYRFKPHSRLLSGNSLWERWMQLCVWLVSVLNQLIEKIPRRLSVLSVCKFCKFARFGLSPVFPPLPSFKFIHTPINHIA